MTTVTSSIHPFSQIPWCATLLSAPNTFILRHLPSRTPKPQTNEDSLFSSTLKSETTIPAALAFYTKHANADPSTVTSGAGKESRLHSRLSLLFAVGKDLDGWPNVLHGGIVATIIDESMGTLLVLNTGRYGSSSTSSTSADGLPAPVGAHTAQLNIRYVRPVVTPGVCLVVVEVTKREGRKIWIRAGVWQRVGRDGEVVGWDEGKGGGVEGIAKEKGGEGEMVECAVGEALFISGRGVKL